MLEGLVAWVLNNYLGKYVENLNTDQLSVALLSGKVELENLPLKKDALRHLGLPVEIKAGFIGKVQLQVPVRQIRSAPWVIAIEKLYLVAAPVNLDEWDSNAEAVIAHERKTALLDALEAQWRAEHEASDAGYYATSYSSWLSYGTGLLANIVENLQLKLKDVHIRYEDPLSCVGGSGVSAFSCGLTVASLCAESCDSEWARGFTLLADADGCSFKLLELHQLAVYWDPMPVPGGMLAHCNITELTERMSETWKGQHRYVVEPASARARVRRERTEHPLRSRTRPRLACHLTLDCVLLNLTSRQYGEAVACLVALERVARLREFRARRPAAPLQGHARAWWLYALSCHVPTHDWTEPKPTWESCLSQCRLVREYVATCLVTLTNPAATLPPDKKAAKDEFEWKTPLHVLKALREVAMRKVPKSTPISTPDKPASSGRSMLVHWFPQWWGWYSSADAAAEPAPQHAPAPAPAPAPADLEEEILDVIADSIDNNTLLKRDTVFGKFEFILNKGSLNLCMEDDQNDARSGSGAEDGAGGQAVELQFRGVTVCVESRPRGASHALHVSLGSVCLRERVTPHSLFPVLVAPHAHGMIREGLSSMSATAAAMSWCRAQAAPPSAHAPPDPPEPLFQLTYEKKPFGLNCDYKLWVMSASVEVVYCAAAWRWARAFAWAPWGGAGGGAAGGAGGTAGAGPLHGTYAHVRDQTKARLRTHWDHMMRAPHHPGERRSWQVELDISAPQILFVEELCSRDASVLVVDFGRLRLANANLPEAAPQTPTAQTSATDDDEMFMTPCSTPPGSLLSPASPPDPPPQHQQQHQHQYHALDAADLHTRLYDRYKIELSDLQILVGRVRDNWKYAHTKSTSSLHLLDRFSISLQAERRVVWTVDPQYPTATVCGSLPTLVVHLSDHKLRAARNVFLNQHLLDTTTTGTFTSRETPTTDGVDGVTEEDTSVSSETEHSELSSHQNSTQFLLQFAIDQMSLEVQSRGRSIAEVQVCGVKAALSARPRDLSLSLSVHSLLLVDALQTYGPDFELLVASHKHVGMDTASGSIRGSEPTSPTSPKSPTSPMYPTSPTSPISPETRAAPALAHPHALHQALYSLHYGTTTKNPPEPDHANSAPSWMTGTSTSFNGSNFFSANPTWGNSWSNGAWGTTGTTGTGWGAAGLVDSEALIAVELCLVKGEGDSEDLRIANILFNNLDIIANQETIVELIGFAQRVLAPNSTVKKVPSSSRLAEPAVSASAPAAAHTDDEVKKAVRTEITFDFHRLGVLLLRAAMLEGTLVARKIATATLSEAKIQATVDASRVSVGGSLGGVQVVSLCEGGGLHTRVLSAGRLLHALPADEEKALFFTINRKVITAGDGEAPVVEASVSVHVARVWYTHSGALLRELRSCLTEFKQYLANLARSIRAAAHDMAIGLVHPRGDSLYSNPKLSQSMEGVSPRRRTTSMGASLDDPTDLNSENIVLSVSISLESPVVVVPRGARSSQVFVAHLGRSVLANRPGAPRRTRYSVLVRDISLASLDVGEKLKTHQLTAENMHYIYDVSAGKPVLHNTALKCTVNYLDGDGDCDAAYKCEVSGKIVGGLHVSARREQYEQLLDTLRWLSAAEHEHSDHTDHPDRRDHRSESHSDHAAAHPQHQNEAIDLVAVPTLRLDPAVRAAVLAVPPPTVPLAPLALLAPPVSPSPSAPAMHLFSQLTVEFELPHISVELRADLGEGERSLVELTFQELMLHHTRLHRWETTLQVSLHSITMEDLTKDPDSKHRMLMVSHTPQMPPKAVYVSKSCPNFVSEYPIEEMSNVSSLQYMRGWSCSLPSELNVTAKKTKINTRDNNKCGVTPPCSPECGVASAGAGTGADESADESADVGAGAGECDSLPAADDNLVWLSVHTRDPSHPRFEQDFDKVSKLTKVDFNCLNLVVSIDSWVAVLDFFGIAGEEPPDSHHGHKPQEAASVSVYSPGITQTEMSIRSLSVVVVAGRGEACRALVRRVRVVSRVGADVGAGVGAGGLSRSVRGRLGALLLADLTPHAPLWRDRLNTHGDHALTFEYHRLSGSEAAAAGHETSLSIEMGPVTYVHTKRFVQELQAFARDFSLLRRVILQARLKVSVSVGARASRMRLRLRCDSPVILLPVSGRARGALAAELTSLHLDNCFKYAGDEGTVSTMTDPDCVTRELLDVRCVQLEGLSLWCARAAGGGGGGGGSGLRGRVRRVGPALLPAPAHLTLHIETNMSDTHNVADMTIQGTLTTLECALDPSQYRLVRGVLAHNLAECVADLQPPPSPQPPAPNPPRPHHVWTATSLRLHLHDVTVKLEPEHGVTSLACINFIKSKLLVETYSDLSQDIDLVSQEILVSDTRYSKEPANRRGNVFSHIVQPMPEQRHSVQLEVHARKREECSAYTILVNNMRLMAVLDWWEAANQFIMQPPPPASDPDQAHLEEALAAIRSTSLHTAGLTSAVEPPQMELKLNVTDSQLVLVEDASVWDTNAVILRSTTVIRYRCADAQRQAQVPVPVSCELNELEVFSCVLGLEEETALSIVDPAALHVAVHQDRQLHVSMSTLNLRLSYHDMRMFASMLQSLPVQARAALSGDMTSSVDKQFDVDNTSDDDDRCQWDSPSYIRKTLVLDEKEDAPANSVHMRAGAGASACTSAGAGASAGGWMYTPRWMRAAPPPVPPPPPQPQNTAIWPLKAVQVNADCITLCVIDDCLDSDVPLLEVSLSELQVEQDLRKVEEAFEDPVLVSTPAGAGGVAAGGKREGAGGGRLAALLTIDYYNRPLSGWEPIVEPWRFETTWEYTLSSELSLGRLQTEIRSSEVLNTNVTSALIELAQLVKANWAADYYAPQSTNVSEQSPKGSPAGHRRRSPFVPYALRNHTGHRLWFTTLLTTSDVLPEQTSWSGPDDSWVCVRAGETEPFSFGGRRARGRGRAARAPLAVAPAPAVLHQLALRLDGWAPPDPICVDRVGVFFRNLTHTKTGGVARIVLEVSLEGSARKLVRVRSALQLVNNLPHPVEVRVDHAPAHAHPHAAAHYTERGRGGLVVGMGTGVGVGVGVGTACLARAHAARVVRAAGAALQRARTHPLYPVLQLHPLQPVFVNCGHWSGSGSGPRSAQVAAGGVWSAPLSAHAGALWTRPLVRAGSRGAGGGVGGGGSAPTPTHSPAAIDWRAAPGERALLHYECRAPPDHLYRFCCVIIRERFPPDRGVPVAGHTLTLVPALRLENLLPLELQYRAARPSAAVAAAAGALPAAETRPFHEVNVEEGVELSVKLEGFGWSSVLSVGGAGGGAPSSFSARLKLRDTRGRRLYLNAKVTAKKTDGIKVSISAAYWLVNRTGLPLVFRAEGSAETAAGQFAEHEVARMVAPLLFSLPDALAGAALAARLGTGLHGYPEWCSPFGLGPGVAVKKLEVRGEEGSGGGGGAAGAGGGAGCDRVYAVGLSVRSGRGRYRHTNIVTFTPRYQLHNNTSHHLQFAQKCTATTLNDPGAIATHVSAVSGCYLPWHWPRWDREHLLCVRILAPGGSGAGGVGVSAAAGGGGMAHARTAWSGGFRVDSTRSLHIACRFPEEGYQLVRVEVVCEGATMFVVLTDAECAPPPIRIDNYSPLTIKFHQVGCGEECSVGAHSVARWALPEPEGGAALALRPAGGARKLLSLDDLGATHTLHYQNFIYVAFTHTHTHTHAHARNHHRDENSSSMHSSTDDNVLVLEVPPGSTRVVLGRKRYGDRSQLWRRGPKNQLIHDGNSTPQTTDAQQHSMVLDIEDAAPRPGRAAPLALRRADPRRENTQSWRLLPPGRMTCGYDTLSVQPDGLSLMALTPGTRVVLALASSGRGAGVGDGSGGGLAPEQAVSWHALRPGSGRLHVTLLADGPTRLVRIRDHEEAGWIEGGTEDSIPPSREWGLRVSLRGVSVSLVSRAPAAELVHALFAGVLLELARAPRATALALAVQDMQWDNQLLGTPSPVLLYCLPERGGGSGVAGGAALPALHAALELQATPTSQYNAYFFRHLVVTLRPLAVRLEERLLLQLWAWARARAAGEGEGAGMGVGEREGTDHEEHEAQRVLHDLTALNATRYYFALIKIMPGQMRLSMCTANKLEAPLGALKRRLGLTLIKFEDAAVELKPFERAHVFDTAGCLARQMLAHFKDVLKWQAAMILGSVDFLGNPLGFVADVSEGVTGFLLEGNVAALFKNVTHGISNSAAKVTESLGDGLERVVSDEAHEETRRRIRSGAPGAHLAAGLRGLGLGILGGMTSLVKHTYEGAMQEGLGGLLTGVGKGLVGTVTKPVIGVLDLATETASALRDTSRRSDKWVPVRVRGPRVVVAAGGLVARYCGAAAEGAALLHALNGTDYTEHFLAHRAVRRAPHDIRALLSDTHLRIITCRHQQHQHSNTNTTTNTNTLAQQPHLVMETHLSNLVSCQVVSLDGAHYVELGVRGGGAGGAGAGGGAGGAEGVRRPRVQCDSAELAEWVARHVAYARQLYHERAHTLHPHPDL